MKIVLRVDRGALRRWHLALAARLAKRPGAEVGFRLEADAPAASKSAAALFQFETLLFALARGGSSERIRPDALGGFADGEAAYLIIDLARSPLAENARIWRVECDGVGLEEGLLASALSGRSPTVRIMGPQGAVATARPGGESLHIVKATFEERLERVATLIEAALDGAAPAVPPAVPGETPAAFDRNALATGRFAARAVKSARHRAIYGVYRALCHTPHWRVGWRRGEGEAAERLDTGWINLPDDGQRFYADPFPIVWRGRPFLFVEDFEHRRGKGVISAVEFGARGPLGAPQPVLEAAVHLSYPHVFERDGEVWMIPESSAAGTVDLYRALDFPSTWRREATLVSGVVASDATIVEWGGRWWMFATVRDGGGAFSDALWLWSAPDFRGPWTAHPRNPVLIDIASARPAGRMFVLRGALHRPVQDCRGGYGAAVGFARVERLDEGGYSQTLETMVRPGAGWPGRRLHTYNAAGGFEFIDGSAFAPRWAALRGPLQFARGREMSLATA
jgi:hypothetical protein